MSDTEQNMFTFMPDITTRIIKMPRQERTSFNALISIILLGHVFVMLFLISSTDYQWNCEQVFVNTKILKFYWDEEKIMTCVPRLQVFNLQTCSQMSLSVHI